MSTTASLYQRAEEFWLELEKPGKLPPAQSHAIREVNNELARSNDALADLQQVH